MLLSIWLLLLVARAHAQQHPVTFFTKAEAARIASAVQRYPLLQQSYDQIKKEVDGWIGKDIPVPVPKDEAGGYTHTAHRFNYNLMFNSGVLYNITNDARYAALVKQLLLKYAKLNSTLPKHPKATGSSPGRLFWQALNDANWLVYTAMAYDLTRSAFTAAERKTIEDGAFRPQVEYFTRDLQKWFDKIHNHGVWACAGVGMVGIATDNKEYVDMALYGTAKDGKYGFLAQMEKLYSPDGYYTEGPYYARYAIYPYYIFANALHRAKPELKIFERRNRILQKALLATLQQTNLDGKFFPVNDAIKDKDFTTNELVTAIDIAWDVYGADAGLLAVAKKQNRVLLNSGGAMIAKAIASGQKFPDHYPYASVEYRDGVNGDEGGISFLRNGKGKDLTTLIFKYSSHGLSHGHFDKLNINLFDKGREILTDYGSARFVNVEQKYGGRYLPENDAYASQTIAHNTVVVDETSQFNGHEKLSGRHHSEKLFSSISDSVQVVSAVENNAYKGVQMKRTVYLVQLNRGKKIMVDVFSVRSADEHQYDLPFQYSGQLIATSFKYEAATANMRPMGTKNGYQYLWKEAEARTLDSLVRFTFLNGNTYYTILSVVEDSAQLFFTRTGANDPNFNLRRDPSFIIRKKGKDRLFVNVLDIHGAYDPVSESSSGSASEIKTIKTLRQDDRYTVIAMETGDQLVYICQSNQDTGKHTQHSFRQGSDVFTWTGPFLIRTRPLTTINQQTK